MTTQFAPAKEKTYSPLRLRKFGSVRKFFIKNWCLKRSRLIYGIVSRWMHGDVKINIAMRCRENACADWGHAWVTLNGTPVMEFRRRLLKKPRTKIAESEKYIYWLYE